MAERNMPPPSRSLSTRDLDRVLSDYRDHFYTEPDIVINNRMLYGADGPEYLVGDWQGCPVRIPAVTSLLVRHDIDCYQSTVECRELDIGSTFNISATYIRHAADPENRNQMQITGGRQIRSVIQSALDDHQADITPLDLTWKTNKGTMACGFRRYQQNYNEAVNGKTSVNGWGMGDGRYSYVEIDGMPPKKMAIMRNVNYNSYHNSNTFSFNPGS